jgi:putative DNA primase/helicase
MRAQVAQTLAREFDQLHDAALTRWRRKTDEADETASGKSRQQPPRPFPVSIRLVSDVLQAVAGLVLIRTADCASQPAWLEAWPEFTSRCVAGTTAARCLPADSVSPWPVNEILPARNVLVHLPSLVEGASCTTAPTPRFFNSFALDYEFSPTAPPPVEWLAFLDQIWEGDEQSALCLQEWFGYLLTPDTSQQKILMMVGPKRSGRGTIARVLKALAGANNVVNPTLSTLARPFGLCPDRQAGGDLPRRSPVESAG